MLNKFFSRLGIALLWLMSFLPYSFIARLGERLGSLLFHFESSRKRVVLTNLRLCFPELNEQQRQALAKENFQWVIRSILERSILWFASADRIRKLVRVESAIDPTDGKPRIVLGMHMSGIEGGGIGSTIYMAERGIKNSVTLYTIMSNRIFDQFIKTSRERFGAIMMERGHSARDLIRMIKRGQALQLSPDMDFGMRDSEFVPFFAIPTCTLTTISRLARLTKAEVVPAVTIMLPNYQGYLFRLLPPLENFPGESITADTLRMNAFFESEIRKAPAQYWWVHKRFKTRPQGEASLYK